MASFLFVQNAWMAYSLSAMCTQKTDLPASCGSDREIRAKAQPDVLSRRKFAALTSGSILCAACGIPRVAGAFKPYDIGVIKDFAKDEISEKFIQNNFFVIRHEGRLFATIATCPHKGNYLLRNPRDARQIICSGHDSVFDPKGVPSRGPVKRGLTRFGISVNAQGRVMVDTDKEFPQKQWNDPGCFITLK